MDDATVNVSDAPPSGEAGDSYTFSFDGKVSTSPHMDIVAATVSDGDGNSVTPSDDATVSFE